MNNDHPFSNPQLTPNAQNLRKNMTPEEKHLWYDFLQNYPVQVKRQKVIGWYIADFYVPMAKLVIELDGNQHFLPEGRKHDKSRDEFMQSAGIEIIRIPNSDIRTNFNGVCKLLDEAIRERSSSTKACGFGPPSPETGEGLP